MNRTSVRTFKWVSGGFDKGDELVPPSFDAFPVQRRWWVVFW